MRETQDFIKEAQESGSGGAQARALEKEIAEMAGFAGTGSVLALRSGALALRMALRLSAERLYGERASGVFCDTGSGYGGRSTAFPLSPISPASPGNGGSGGSGQPEGVLSGRRVFCPDLCPPSLVGAVLREGGEPVFIDVSPEDWCMDPEVLETAFDLCPDVRLAILCHLHGFPGQAGRIKEICGRHGALLVEDASESFGAGWMDGGGLETQAGKWTAAGSVGDYGILDFGGGRIAGGCGGGMLLTRGPQDAQDCPDWKLPPVMSIPPENALPACLPQGSGQHHADPDSLRDLAMGDLAAAHIRGKLRHLGEEIGRKKEIYQRYQECFNEDLVWPNPVREGTLPNYWMPCLTCESLIPFQARGAGQGCRRVSRHGTASPMEIHDALRAAGFASGPVYKPMSRRHIFRHHEQVSLDGSRRQREALFPGGDAEDDFTDPWGRGSNCEENSNAKFSRAEETGSFEQGGVGGSVYARGLRLPSDSGMTAEEQDRVIAIIHACFD